MSRVLKKQKIAENTFLIDVEAPEIAKKIGPGQFVIIRTKPRTEGICVPVGMVKRNSITIVVKGEKSKMMLNYKKNDHLNDVVGPIGNRANVEEVENVCLIADSYGIPVIYNLAKMYKENKIPIAIVIGEKSKRFLYWEDKLKDLADKIYVFTEDGSRGEKGTVPFHLRNLFYEHIFELAIVSGSPAFMHEVSNFTRQRVKTKAIVNPLMIDPIGLSGTCRIRVDEKIKFAAIEGPEFNAHSIDFEEFVARVGKGYG